MVLDVKAPLTGNVWKIVVTVGQKVAQDEELLILESMKMEIPVVAVEAGTVAKILCKEGQAVGEDDVLVVLDV